MEAIEKQQRLQNIGKAKKKEVASAALKRSKQTEVKKPKNEMRRMIVAGKVVYVDNKPKNEVVMPTTKRTEMVVIPQSESVTKTSEIVNVDDDTEPVRRLPSAFAKNMAIHSNKIKEMQIVKKGSNDSNKSNKKIPARYAKEIDKDVKKQTVKNVKNFADLRRVKALENIAPDSDIDANKASIAELRKLRIEQRKREQTELKKKSESNKKESAIQDILKNDKMSKFAKTVAIKNLSVNSRHKNPAKPNSLDRSRDTA
jgi:hypothetical protein